MTVLWICNIIIPEIEACLSQAETVTGGWLTGIINSMTDEIRKELVVCVPDNTRKFKGEVRGYRYFSYYRGCAEQVSDKTVKEFVDIFDNIKPDIIHIFGTEYPHTYAAVCAAKQLHLEERIVISIQGLVSLYAEHYYAMTPTYTHYLQTIRDIIRHTSIQTQKKAFKCRGNYEIKSLREVHHCIGRTEWDFACTKRINSDIHYHFCNESLRDSFYDGQIWKIEECKKHTIFVTQSSYPIKGFHILIDAVYELKQKYSDIMVYTTGKDLFKKTGFLADQKLDYYHYYLKRKIEKLGLKNNITFLGVLTENEIKKNLLNSNCYVCPSSIENSPNSLGEAMLLGVPCIVSDVGGVSSMLKHESEGFLYPFDEPYMLAHYIDRVFKEGSMCVNISANARKHALQTHDRNNNLNALYAIYESIAES